MDKHMKPGYQGKSDAMRDKAEKMLGGSGNAPDVIYSKSCAEKEKMRPYKGGGSVKSCHKYAAGGVAKIRHGQSTPSGKQKG